MVTVDDLLVHASYMDAATIPLELPSMAAGATMFVPGPPGMAASPKTF